MNIEERQLLGGLFDRIRAASNGPRDAQAEAFIAENVKAQPYASYLLAQTVLVQEQALSAANQRLQELEARLQSLESQQSGGFLGGLGKSLFGGGASLKQPPSAGAAPQPQSASPSSPWGQGQPQATPSAGPWTHPQATGGSFLSGALTTAAGVAGGMLLADSVRNLFTGGHNATMAGMAGPGLLGGSDRGETVSNYTDADPAAVHAQDVLQDMDQDQDDVQDAADYSGVDPSGDDSFDV